MRKNRKAANKEFQNFKWRVRRRRERQKRIVLLISACLILCFILFSKASFITKADASDDTTYYKYYTGIVVKSGDTVSSIAAQYMDPVHYRSQEEYMDEICSINHLFEPDDIKIGKRLVIPYYSTEFVK